MNRRLFLERISQASLIIGSSIDFGEARTEEYFWQKIKADFAVSRPGYLYLNSGSAGVMPKSVLESWQGLQSEMNIHAPYRLWEWWQEDRHQLKLNLSELIGASVDEIAIQRNTTEALNNILLSLDIEPSDEILMAAHEYPSMVNALKLRSLREGFNLKIIDFEFPITNKQILKKYKKAISKKTRYLLVSHMSFNHGRIFPMAKLSKIMKEASVEVIVDAAHSYGQIKYSTGEIGANYLGTSLHKWLCAPHGSGLLYINKDKIANCHQLMSTTIMDETKIEKFEHLGTRAFHSELGIKFSFDYLKNIGLDKKEARLRELSTYLLDKLKDIKGFKNYTSNNPKDYAGILAFSFEQKGAGNIKRELEKNYGIIVKSTSVNDTTALRVSSNVYILKEDLDYFVDALVKTINS